MKKTILLLLSAAMILSLLFSLAACGTENGNRTGADNTEANTAENTADKADEITAVNNAEESAKEAGEKSADRSAEEPAKSPEVPQTEVSSTFAAAFTEGLRRISQDYHPGTAGCSLTAAAIAAEIMDVFTACAPSAEEIRECVKQFTESLADEELSFKIDAVISASEELNGENGKELLDSCGYTGTGYPWDAEKMTECFAAMKLS